MLSVLFTYLVKGMVSSFAGEKKTLVIRKLYRLHLYIVTMYNFIIFVWDYNLMDHLCYLCLVIIMLLRQFIAA